MVSITCFPQSCSEAIPLPPMPPPVTVPGPGVPPPVVVDPAPTISGIAPTTAVAGGPAFTLTVTGSNFTAASVVKVDGANVVTTFVSATSLTASVTPLAAAGNMSVLVRNSDGLTSNTKTISITAPVVIPPPVLTSIAPTTAVAGGPAYTLTATGTGFTAASVINVIGLDVATTFVNAQTLTASLTPPSGAANQVVLVRNGDGQTSNAMEISITAPPVVIPAPVITSLTPNTASAGSATFIISVAGSNFTAASIINVNGVDVVTSFATTQVLTAQITPPATEGTMPVLVRNSDGATSNSMLLTITPAVAIPAPVLNTVSPATTMVGALPFQLTANGDGFTAGSVINVNGVDVVTTFVNNSLLTATASPAGVPGPMPVFVRGGDGQISNTVPITVNPFVNTGSATIQGFYPDFVVAGGPTYNLKVLGEGFYSSTVVRFDGVDQLTSYTVSAVTGQETLSVNALTPNATPKTVHVTLKESSGGLVDVGQLTFFDPAVSAPSWVPDGATHYVDFINDIQARGWNGVVVCDNVSMTAMLGNDSNAAAYHTPNPTGYNSNNVTDDGYDWNKGQNQVPAFEGTMKEAIIYHGATVVLDYNSNSTKNDIHFAIVAGGATNHIAIKKVGLDVVVTSKNGPLNLTVVGALIEPPAAPAVDFVLNRIAFTKTPTPSSRFEIAVNGSPVVAGILDSTDLVGLVAVCDQTKLIGRYEVYPALPDTTGLSELSSQ
jgi:hypothetical protein